MHPAKEQPLSLLPHIAEVANPEFRLELIKAVVQVFEGLLFLLQCKEPEVHVIHGEIMDLVCRFMSRYSNTDI